MRAQRVVLAALAVLGALGLAGLGLLAMPEGAGGPLAAWCRPDGRIELVRALAVVSPLAVAAALGVAFRRVVRRASPESLLAHGIATAALTGLVAALLSFAAAPAGTRRDALPAATLTDQDGRPLALDGLRGSPALVGAVYSRCSTACPMALADLRRVLEALTPEEREALGVVLVTLDPAHDTPERLRAIAEGYGLASPRVRFLTGEASTVERVLDELGFQRRRDPASGLIEHRVELIVADVDGRIVGRWPAGEEASRSLVARLRSLLAERRARS